MVKGGNFDAWALITGKMKRVSTLLKEETIAELEKEAMDKSISLSAVVRQRVEGISNRTLISGEDVLHYQEKLSRQMTKK